MTVKRIGTDSSGRPIFMSDHMAAWWADFTDALGFAPTITQGPWMSLVPGGGAADSAGYHDRGGPLDLRLWDRTAAERQAMVREARKLAAAYWERDEARGGMELHAHLVIPGDPHMSPGCAQQLADYRAGRNGMTGSSAGPDYHWRPSPLVTTYTPEDDVAAEDVWQHPVKERDDSTKATERSAEYLLADAHRRAGDAAKSARRAERAVVAIGKALGPEVEQAVLAALEDAVVDVTVTVGGESK